MRFTKSKLISSAYIDANKALHQSPDYGRHGSSVAEVAIRLAAISGTRTILDYGCGKGRFSQTIRLIAPEQEVFEYDPAIEGKDALPSSAGMIVCNDVLEHIEPGRLRAVLAHIASLMETCGLFTIHHGPAIRTLPDGRNAHLIQKSPDWWSAQLTEHFEIKKISKWMQSRTDPTIIRSAFVVGRLSTQWGPGNNKTR